MSGLSLITQTSSFTSPSEVDMPHAEVLLAGHILGVSVRDSLRSIQPAC